jgi:predicted RNase H-like nuclease (RuvC/YqgF family)
MNTQTELEKFQAARIESLERELQRHKDFISEMETDFKKFRDEITNEAMRKEIIKEIDF